MARYCSRCGTPRERHPGRSCPTRPLTAEERTAQGLPAELQPGEPLRSRVDHSMLIPESHVGTFRAVLARGPLAGGPLRSGGRTPTNVADREDRKGRFASFAQRVGARVKGRRR